MTREELLEKVKTVDQPRTKDLKEALKIFQNFKPLKDSLKKINFIRSLHLQADFSEAYVAIKLGLKLMPLGNKHFDAIDNYGLTYQIKYIVRHDEKNEEGSKYFSSYPYVRYNKFDYLIVLIFKPNFEIENLIIIPMKDLIANTGLRKLILRNPESPSKSQLVIGNKGVYNYLKINYSSLNKFKKDRKLTWSKINN
ncbi:MAG: hypothetical protein NTW25_07845 [Candidatus Kapabacteria bacterium]|nr:hypothetical protein [Candidatus Kapabacteria bacterium]